MLAWINRLKSDAPVFVRNRVAAIRQLSGDFEWKHVPTTMNPADLISRGVYPVKLMESVLWWHGPEFLRTNDAVLPQFDGDDADGDSGEDYELQVQALAATTYSCMSLNPALEAINRCSNYRRESSDTLEDLYTTADARCRTDDMVH